MEEQHTPSNAERRRDYWREWKQRKHGYQPRPPSKCPEEMRALERTYQHWYYLNVTKPKREAARKAQP